jgi:hypothetical protein
MEYEDRLKIPLISSEIAPKIVEKILPKPKNIKPKKKG